MSLRTGIVVIAWLCFGSLARADTPAEAKQAFAAGKAAFERGDYETALTQFQRADSIAPAPSLYYNIGMTYERLGRYQDAAVAFEHYLTLAGPPQTDDERQFQDNLRARAAANHSRAERAETAPPANQPAPPPPPPGQPMAMAPGAPPPNYYPYSYSTPIMTPPMLKEMRLRSARAHRNRGIALVAVGAALTLIGVGLTVDGALNPHDGFNNVDNESNYFEDFIGVSCLIVGATLVGPGAASWARSQRKIDELTRPDFPPQPGLPHAMLFSLPAVRF